MQYQILPTNITRTMWQIVRRITNEILGVKGLNAEEIWIYKYLYASLSNQRYKCIFPLLTLVLFTSVTPNWYFFHHDIQQTATKQFFFVFFSFLFFSYILHLHMYLHYTYFLHDAYTTLTCTTYNTYITIQLH